MPNARYHVPPPKNEPNLHYAPGSPEKAALKAELARQASEVVEIPVVVGGRRIHTGRVAEARMPHRHGHVLARFHQAGPAEVEAAALAAREARREWASWDWTDRAAVFLKAAELLAGPWRQVLNAATILGQSKTVFQAEIDSACEVIDFWRWNTAFAQEIYGQQPVSSAGIWNRVEHRPLEGFVFAVTPFNFTAIGANLPTSPALMGNTVLWKPATTAIFSNWQVLRLLEEAGLPPGVVNFLPGAGREVGDPVLAHPDFAGIHFTGSTGVFQGMWRTIAENLPRYRSYPRIVGETGGKDFVFAHPSADVRALVVALVRGAFEYQGQKCSAASRAYVPRSLWPRVKDMLVAETEALRMGDPADFRTFVGAVIDRKAFDGITGYVDVARASSEATIIAGGKADPSTGWFIRPTIVETTNPRFRLMEEEIFGPVLTVFVYDDARLDEALALCDGTSPYALTGAVFAQDRRAVVKMAKALENAAGNFYVNDKPTGAVVGQQPFGGARASGTNDKAGALSNLMRWVSQRAIKENFVPPTTIAYPHHEET
ncbi:MAG TPA: L-glutamate gamma-semialdehyde dehydrogenase [Anaeromyxobacteraceae bacterium]|nr:L-glutamate gamma-semialdehyde dehydrogenase [Anaeromyxobacteraceae bacterium]